MDLLLGIFGVLAVLAIPMVILAMFIGYNRSMRNMGAAQAVPGAPAPPLHANSWMSWTNHRYGRWIALGVGIALLALAIFNWDKFVSLSIFIGSLVIGVFLTWKTSGFGRFIGIIILLLIALFGKNYVSLTEKVNEKSTEVLEEGIQFDSDEQIRPDGRTVVQAPATGWSEPAFVGTDQCINWTNATPGGKGFRVKLIQQGALEETGLLLEDWKAGRANGSIDWLPAWVQFQGIDEATEVAIEYRKPGECG